MFRTPDCASPAKRPKRYRNLDAKNAKALIWPLVVIAIVVATDQTSKIWAVNNLIEHGSQPVMGEFLMFSLIYNQGGAMGTSFGPSGYYLGMALLILPLVLFYIYRNRHLPIISIPLAFIAGGAIGNLIDRIRLGRVIDFIDIDFFDIVIGDFRLYRWWTFNVADAAISCAIVFLVIHLLVNRQSLEPQVNEALPPIDPGETDRIR